MCILLDQRPHGTEIDHIPSQRIIQFASGKHVDTDPLPFLYPSQFAATSDLIAKTNTASAAYAPLGIKTDPRSQIHFVLRMGIFGIAP